MAMNDTMTEIPTVGAFDKILNGSDLAKDIGGLIFDYLSPSNLHRLKRTCKRMKLTVESYIAGRFSINGHLTRFFKNPQEFRSLQARTATLISGSSALQFFNRVTYEDSDLDLYTHYNHRHEVGHWLIQNGFVYKPNSMQDPDFDTACQNCIHPELELQYNMRGVSAVLNFTKIPSQGAAELKVQIIVACRAPIDAILDFHSTIVLNVISWDRAYSLYPRATLEDHTGLYLRPDTHVDHRKEIIAKYEKRGWTFCMSRGDLEKHDRAFTNAIRWIGDSESWIIKLDLDGVTPPPPVNDFSRPLTRDPCCFTSWWLKANSPYASRIVRDPSALTTETQSSKSLSHSYASVFDLRSPVLHPISRVFKSIEEPCDDQLIEETNYIDQCLVEFVEEHLEAGESWRQWPTQVEVDYSPVPFSI